MEETSIIDFLKLEIQCFRELLSSFIAEELAYKNADHSRLFDIFNFQKQILTELKDLRPKRFQPFNLKNDVDASLLKSLKDQLDLLVDRVKDQYQRNLYVKNLCPQTKHVESIKQKLKTETLEDEC
jgi:hypothetical protein